MRSPHEQQVGHVEKPTSYAASSKMTPGIQWSPQELFLNQEVLPHHEKRAQRNEEQGEVPEDIAEGQKNQLISGSRLTRADR